MSKSLILGLALVLLISGCLGGGTTANVLPNTGITITDFSADPLEVLRGDPVLFQMGIENTGGTTAGNVRVELFGVQSQWKDASGDDLLEDTQEKEFGTLNPPIPERNLPGGSRLAQWQLVTPDIPQGVTTPLPIEARVTFDYNTSGFMQITAVTEDEFQRQRIQGATPDPPFITNSIGPLQLSIPTADEKRFIVLDTAGDEFEYPFRITFMNVGSGFPVTDELDGGNFIGAGGRLSGTINLYGPGVEFADCLGVTGGTEINLDDTEILPRVRSSQKADIACSINFDTSEWGDRPTDKVIMVFNIFYTYYEKKSVTVSVIGR